MKKQDCAPRGPLSLSFSLFSPLALWISTILIAGGTTVQKVNAQSSLSVCQGYTSQTVFLEPSSPYGLSGFAVHPLLDQLYVSVLNQVLSIDAKGQRRVLHQFPIGQTAGLMAVPPGSLFLYFSSPQTAVLYRRELLSGRQLSWPGLKNAFDLALAPTGEVLVVANPSWPTPGAKSGIWHLDPNKGKHREVIKLDGPSGPMLFDAKGNLLYARVPSTYPTPPGSVQVHRFSAAAVQKVLGGGTPLNLSQSQVVLRGLDGAMDMVFDDRQRLHISDPQHGGLRRTLPGSLVLDPLPLVTPSKLTTLGLQFVRRGPASFDPYQPEAGGRLYVATSDWLSTAEVRSISALRPRLKSKPTGTVPAGTLRLDLDRAPAKAMLWLLASTRPPLNTEIAVFYENGVPVWLGLDLSYPHAILMTGTDSQGKASLQLSNPGGLSLRVAFQALAAGGALPGPRYLGTTNVHSLTILP